MLKKVTLIILLVFSFFLLTAQTGDKDFKNIPEWEQRVLKELRYSKYSNLTRDPYGHAGCVVSVVSPNETEFIVFAYWNIRAKVDENGKYTLDSNGELIPTLVIEYMEITEDENIILIHIEDRKIDGNLESNHCLINKLIRIDNDVNDHSEVRRIVNKFFDFANKGFYYNYETGSLEKKEC